MKFALYLLTPVINSAVSANSPYYLKDLMTYFESQVDNFGTTVERPTTDDDWEELSLEDSSKKFHQYTYEEKFKISKNSKKTLSFSLAKTVWVEDKWIENPFANLMQIGTLLLLEDFYENHHLFIVNNIQYTFNSNNVIYQVSCEDAFSYNSSRQNSGYTIENDSSSEEFIGAKNLDWWVEEKIIKECHPTYQYLDLSTGLYRNISGDILPFYNNSDLDDIDVIIKKPYVASEEQDLFDTFMFSCSGSSTNGALISLAEQRDLQLIVYEHLDEKGMMAKIFWFEPFKNSDRITGLTYSPKSSIASFSLGHAGASLTSVLNVQGPTIDEELITLIPNIPSFFFSRFQDEEWEQSNFTESSFTKMLDPKIFTFSKDDLEVLNTTVTINDKEYTLIKISDLAIWKEDNIVSNYPVLSFNDSYITITQNDTDIVLTPRSCQWLLTLIQGSEDSFETSDAVLSFTAAGDEVPAYSESADSYWCLAVNTSLFSITSDITSLTISFNHIVTQDEKDFADAADRCPWLENKLIDFSYFKEQNLISDAEYKLLMDYILNKLRKVNGRLMCYTSAYYNALHQKTRILAEITNNFDSLGAACHADIIDVYETKGSVTDYSYFNSAYKQLFAVPSTKKTPLFNYDEVLTDYFNKFFNANQRFLKNIYNFRHFFEAPVAIPGDGIYQYDYSIINDTTGSERWYYNFSRNNLDKALVDKNFTSFSEDGKLADGVNIYSLSVSNNVETYTPVELVTKYNYNTYYTKNLDAALTRSISYDADTQYYRRVFIVSGTDEILSTIYPSTTIEYTQTTDNKYIGAFILKIDDTTEWPVICIGREEKIDDDENTVYYLTFALRNEWVDTLWFNNGTVLTSSALATLFSDATLQQAYYASSQWISTSDDILSNADISFSYEPVSSADMINNWINKQATTSTIWATNYSQIYTCADDIATLYKDAYEYTNSTTQVSTTFKYKDIIFNTNVGNYEKENLITWMPVEDLYWYGYNAVEEVNVSGEKEIIYYNASGDKVTSLKDSDKQFLKIPYVTEANNSEFYRYVYAPTAGEKFGTEIAISALSSTWATIGIAALVGAIYSLTADDRKRLRQDISKENDRSLEKKDISSATGFKDDCALRYTTDSGSWKVYNTSRTQKDWNYKPLVYDHTGFTPSMALSTAEDYSCSKYLREILGNRKSFYFKDSYWVKCVDTTYANPVSSYGLLNLGLLERTTNLNGKTIEETVLVNDGHNFFTAPEENGDKVFLSSNIVWHPLTSLFVSLSFEGLEWKNRPTVADALKKLFLESGMGSSFKMEGSIITVARFGIKFRFMLFENRTYKLNKITPDNSNAKISIYSASNSYFDQDKAYIGSFFYKDIASGYIYLDLETSKQFVSVETTDTFDLDNSPEYYKKADEKTFKRVYTIKQAMALNQFYYFSKTTLSEVSFTKDLTYAQLEIIKHKQKWDNNTLVSDTIEKIFSITNELELSWPANFTNGQKTLTDQIITIDDDEINLTVKQTEILDSFENVNNGTFWYTYHNQLDEQYSICFSQAASIEAELTQYWTQAYTASKYADYYLPQSWTDSINSKENKAFSALMIEENNNLKIGSLLPLVKIYSQDGVTKLPKYTWVRNCKSSVKDNGSTLTGLSHNSAIRDILKALGENINNFSIEENGTTTYYYVEYNGLTWSQFIEKQINVKYAEYGGLYEMIYKYILSNYSFYELTLYERYKEEQEKLWKQIYGLFEHVIVERSYTNSDATNAKELYDAAKYDMLDTTIPERQYNISINNIALLRGYNGWELRIGDPIELAADEFYSDTDLIYKSLKQYLFISDISYDLRDPSKFAITVNNIKYGDKLINRLVKHIK